MGGICGFNYEDKSLFKKMCDTIFHRGPSGYCDYTNSGISIGMRWLSTNHLSNRTQVQHNEEEDIWMVWDGSIYNSLELRNLLENKAHKFYTKSDTETIIHAYEEWGGKCLNKLRGPFAICIYDLRKHILFLARDPLGLKPLYYYFDGENFIFASEIKSLLHHNVKKNLSLRAFNFYLSFSYIPNELTLIKKIYKVPPSSFLIFDLNKKDIKIMKYGDLSFKIKKDKTPSQLAIELKNLFEESVRIRLSREIPIGAFLSGGLDSSVVVGVMNKFMEEPVKTFSIGFEEGAQVNETKYAQIIADYNNTDHKEYIVKSTVDELLPKLVWHLDDLFSDAAIIPVFILSKFAKKTISIILTGDGADEIFAGYSQYFGYFKPNIARFIPNQLFDFIMKFYKYIPSHKLQMILSFLSLSRTKEDILLRRLLRIKDTNKENVVPFKSENIKSLLRRKFNNNLDVINQMINFDLKHQLPNLYNMKDDRTFMAASLEARIPFLDKKLVEWSTSIPPEMKLNGTIEKYILRLAMKDVLPPKILKRKKLGFSTPVNLWLKNGLREISGELLERLEKRKKIIRSSYVKKVKKRRSQRFYQFRAWDLIMFELWYETFIENSGFSPIHL